MAQIGTYFWRLAYKEEINGMFQCHGVGSWTVRIVYGPGVSSATLGICIDLIIGDLLINSYHRYTQRRSERATRQENIRIIIGL
jgi:hypothetical protein